MKHYRAIIPSEDRLVQAVEVLGSVFIARGEGCQRNEEALRTLSIAHSSSFSILVHRRIDSSRSRMSPIPVQCASRRHSLSRPPHVPETSLGNSIILLFFGSRKRATPLLYLQSNKLKRTTGYTIQSFYSVMEKIFWLVAKARVHDKWAITRKYRHVKHHCVALIELPSTLPYLDMDNDCNSMN